MPRLSSCALALVLSFSAVASLSAQDPTAPVAPDAPPLSIDECIGRAMKKNFDLQIQNYSTDQAKETVEIAKAVFDPNLTATVNRTYSQAASATSRLDGTSVVGVSNDQTSGFVQVTDELPQTGGIVGITGNLGRRASNSGNNFLNPEFDSNIAASISQPLLRNAGGYVAKAQVNRAKIGVTIAQLAYKSRVLTVIRDTENAYYSLVAARETQRIRQLTLDYNNALFAENQARRTTGTMTDLDVLTAEVGVANARRALVQAEGEVRTAEDNLLALISGSAEDFKQRPGPVNFAPFTDPAPEFATSYKQARDYYPDYLSTAATIKQLEIDLSLAKAAAQAGLNLNASLGYSAKATDQGYWDSVDNLPHDHGNSWSIGLAYTMPWGLRADRARVRSTLAGVNQEKTRLDQLEQQLLVQVRAAVRSVQTNLVAVDIAAKASELALRQYELQKARFDAGLSTSRLVLQAQDDLESARFDELNSKVTLRTSVAELHRLEGSSVDRFKVQLPQ